jgi:DNA-binding NarL/FixJ family response regulator
MNKIETFYSTQDEWINTVENMYIQNYETIEWLKQLPDRDKCVCFMLQMGYKQKEIAYVLGCNRKTITRRKKLLKKSYQKKY